MTRQRRASAIRRLPKSAWFAVVALAVLVSSAGGIVLGTSPDADAAPTARPSATASRSAEATPEATPEASTSPTRSPAATATPSAPAVAPEPGTAAALLETLPVKGRAPKTGYEREAQYGTAWIDVDRNGCDTRNDILARDLTEIDRPAGCRVLSGTLDDPYTGSTIDFVRGNTTSTAVQIDHVVALVDSWQKGAQRLSQAERVALANDPLNLFAVDGHTNAQKGGSDAASWLPPQKAFRCEYVAHQVSVKAAYHLWVTQAEHDAIAGVLAVCPGQVAYTSTLAAAASASPDADAGDPDDPDAETVTYANCDAVRTAGAAPIRTGDPGYSRKLDRDGDGVGCE
ncbi:GmrSD restriction endonuclease domain-containing protein [Microbacterium terricola]|uniref:Calcium-binding protein n=1 Tax=Microbacterium terricola TaxID=344163 RepID=A0ABM8E0Z2_9MICO|nr:DUF1524 domain-containing protein [Microbacterium terricola]UYK40841.1 excalibur calcium-binding domain-containing protein [Microbacterium terricola]BDV31411.1 calcium-binding protein [Microbacterium terricola]